MVFLLGVMMEQSAMCGNRREPSVVLEKDGAFEGRWRRSRKGGKGFREEMIVMMWISKKDAAGGSLMS